jgi:hypothetical protein
MDKARASGDVHIRASIEAMQASSLDERGTVQALAREVDEEAQDSMYTALLACTYSNSSSC